MVDWLKLRLVCWVRFGFGGWNLGFSCSWLGLSVGLGVGLVGGVPGGRGVARGGGSWVG